MVPPSTQRKDKSVAIRIRCCICSNLRWLLGDHLGSTSYTANGTTESGEVRYKPFGSTRYSSGSTPTTYRYTGQREEAGLGLYYYGARWYDPALGRFIQPDTIVPNPADAKSFDRFAYVNNNPLRYVDPSGHCKLNSDGSRDPADVECWQIADHIYNGLYQYNTCRVGCLGDRYWGEQKFQMSRDEWMSTYGNIAGINAGLLKTWVDEFYAANSHGQPPKYEPGSVPRHPIEVLPSYDLPKLSGTDVGITVLKSGQYLGPVLSKFPHPVAKTVGIGITVVGKVTDLVTDLAPAAVKFSKGDIAPLLEEAGQEIVDRTTGVPGLSVFYDWAKLVWQGACPGGGCK